jgi:hypothetical protein
MTLRLEALCIRASDPPALARFWGELLGSRPDVAAGDVVPALVPPLDDTGLALRFVPTDEPHVRPDRIHLHLTSTSEEHQRETVRRALELGARPLDVGQLPEEEHVVLADPDGYAFCVLEAGNGFTAGCGFLGEVGCEGTREVGHFWAAALDWPLVWDQDGETAVQSPDGGPKVAWGGPPLPERHGPDRMGFDLVTDDDLGAAVDRLLGLGATPVREGPQGWVLADPDGTEFRLARG